MRPLRFIGHTVWEWEQVPDVVVEQTSVADELWVPTYWNQWVLGEALRRPVHVVPHAISVATPVDPPVYELPTDRTLFVAVAAWDWRKRPDRTIEAYLRAFTSSDDVLLMVKSTRMPVAWPHRQDLPTVAHIHQLCDQYPDRAPVVIDTGDWADGELIGLFQQADCFVSLTSSEGWGLGAFDAAALGTPVIIGGYGGQVEWLGADYPGLLPFNMVHADHPDLDTFTPDVTWAEPDMDTAIDMMRALHDGEFAELREHAATLAPDLQRRYSPRQVGQAAATALGLELETHA